MQRNARPSEKGVTQPRRAAEDEETTRLFGAALLAWGMVGVIALAGVIWFLIVVIDY
jgi:hypothetical protein